MPEHTNGQVTCVVADDHPAMVEVICGRLAESGVSVLAVAANGFEALRLVEELRPMLVLLDVEMPGLSGIEICAEIKRKNMNDAVKVILYTAHGQQALLREALDTGAKGFLSKQAPLSEIKRAVDEVVSGGSYVDPTLAAALAGPETVDRLTSVTKREREVLRLLAQGFTTDEAAKKLFLSPDTVRTHVRKAMRKLESSTRTEAVAKALRMELIV
jgi:DNA-binding NarL/FixJ family response regulator